MPTFNFAPRISTSVTVTVMSPFPTGFAAVAERTVSSSITFPSGSVLDGSFLSVRDDDDCDSDDEEDNEGSKTPPGQGGTPPGQAKKACRTSTNSAALASTSTTTSNPKSPPPTAIPSIQTASTSPGATTSRPTQTSSATTTDGSSASTDGRSPGSQESTAGYSTSASSSTTASSPSTPLTGSTASASEAPAANLSTPSPPTTSSFSSATAPPAGDHDLSVASAVGIALGVFAVTAILVAAAVALFLFLGRRRRKRRRRRDDGASERKLASSEGAPSRPLSSTWSWFGSVAIGSEPDPDPEHTFGQHPRDSDSEDPFRGLGMGSEKSAKAMRDPTVPQFSLHEVEVEFVQDVPNLTRSSAGASADDASDPAWGTPERLDGINAEEQGARDPFVDSQCSGIISGASIKGNSVEVENVNVR